MTDKEWQQQDSQVSYLLSSIGGAVYVKDLIGSRLVQAFHFLVLSQWSWGMYAVRILQASVLGLVLFGITVQD